MFIFTKKNRLYRQIRRVILQSFESGSRRSNAMNMLIFQRKSSYARYKDVFESNRRTKSETFIVMILLCGRGFFLLSSLCGFFSCVDACFLSSDHFCGKTLAFVQ
jgi:hypothetical protein